MTTPAYAVITSDDVLSFGPFDHRPTSEALEIANELGLGARIVELGPWSADQAARAHIRVLLSFSAAELAPAALRAELEPEWQKLRDLTKEVLAAFDGADA